MMIEWMRGRGGELEYTVQRGRLRRYSHRLAFPRHSAMAILPKRCLVLLVLELSK